MDLAHCQVVNDISNPINRLARWRLSLVSNRSNRRGDVFFMENSLPMGTPIKKLPIKCRACGVALEKHLGLLPTCEELHNLKKALRVIVRASKKRGVSLDELRATIYAELEMLPPDWEKVR